MGMQVPWLSLVSQAYTAKMLPVLNHSLQNHLINGIVALYSSMGVFCVFLWGTGASGSPRSQHLLSLLAPESLFAILVEPLPFFIASTE